MSVEEISEHGCFIITSYTPEWIKCILSHIVAIQRMNDTVTLS